MTPPIGPPNAPSWSPAPALVGTAWALGAGMAAWSVFGGNNPAGRLLIAIAAVGLAVFALFGTVARPRLAADTEGIVVRRLFGGRRWPWHAVRVRVTSTRRFGRDVSLLELDGHDDDGAETLVVLGWLDLGTEPREVADVLRALRP
jgi:hypothetical protein